MFPPRFLVFLIIFASLCPALARVRQSIDLDFDTRRFHLISDRTLYYSKEKVYEAFGHVVLSSKNSRLSANYMQVNIETGEMKLEGDVKYTSSLWFIHSEKMNFNIKTGLGKIFFGFISSDNYKLRGDLIEKVSKDRFLVKNGEYTFCGGCSEDWKFHAEEVDFRVNGYAFMKNVSLIVDEVPILYLPFFVVPVGSNRRSGLLFPEIEFGDNNGFGILQPLFLTLGDHQDLTLSYGYYAKRGSKLEFQYRYHLTPDTLGELNAFYLKDKSFPKRADRFAINTQNTWSFGEHLSFRWRFRALSDREYVWVFPSDVNARYLPSVESNALLNLKSNFYFFTTEMKRHRSLISPNPVDFDENMVQSGPNFYFGISKVSIFPKLYASFYSRYDNFFRTASSFYDDNENDVFDPFSLDRVREVKRLHLNPEIDYSFRLGKILKVRTSLQYRANMYWFDKENESLNLDKYSNEYLLFRTELSTILERIYDTNGEKVEKLKHQISPFITYNRVPWVKDDATHPFKYQLRQEGGAFDSFDLIPLHTSRYNLSGDALKNSITYGVISRLIQKRKVPLRKEVKGPKDLVAPYRGYKHLRPQNRKEELAMQALLRWEMERPFYRAYHYAWIFSLEQAYDFSQDVEEEEPGTPFSPLLLRSELELENFSNYIEYQYKPYGVLLKDEDKYEGWHELKFNINWSWEKYENFRETLFFNRGIDVFLDIVTGPIKTRNAGLGFHWSFNDYFSWHYNVDYDLLVKRKKTDSVFISYYSPSECWDLRLGYRYDRERGYSIGFDFGLSL